MNPPLTNQDLGRFLRKIEFTFIQQADGSWQAGCWLWCAGKHSRGYGQFKLRERMVKAHAVLLTVSDGIERHHVCENTLCVRPHVEHVTPLTPLEHRRWHAAKRTHCKHGHEFTPENIYITPDGRWNCRACRRKRAATSEYKAQSSKYRRRSHRTCMADPACRELTNERRRIRRAARKKVDYASNVK